jgi:hypothetical protein
LVRARAQREHGKQRPLFLARQVDVLTAGPL